MWPNQVQGVMSEAGYLAGGPSYVPAAAEDAKRRPEVHIEMERLAESIEAMGRAAEILADRLKPIRRQAGGVNGGGTAGQVPQPVQCGLATVLRERREAVERYTTQLHITLAELEI